MKIYHSQNSSAAMNVGLKIDMSIGEREDKVQGKTAQVGVPTGDNKGFAEITSCLLQPGQTGPKIGTTE